MKVFAFILQPSVAKFIMSDIVEALMKIGWQVLWVDLDEFINKNKYLSRKEKYDLLAKLIVDIEEFKPDIVFSYGLEYFNNVFSDFLEELTPSLYEMLKKPGCSFLFDFGYPFNEEIPFQDFSLLSGFQSEDHYFFCWDREAVDILKKKYGIIKTRFFPMAVNEQKFYKKKSNPEYESNIVFIGGPSEERIKVLEQLYDFGLKIYGYQKEVWQENNKLKGCYEKIIISRPELLEVYNAADISVNITRPHGFSSLNVRVYEAMAAGTLMLTDDKSDARGFFIPDKEIVIYTDAAEAREKAEYFLKNKKKLADIAEAGRKRVLNEHTYIKRIKDVLPVITGFFKEHIIFKKVNNLIEKDIKTAVHFLNDKKIKDRIKYNIDNYYYELAETYYKLENYKLSSTFLNQVLKINSNHYNAGILKKKLQER